MKHYVACAVMLVSLASACSGDVAVSGIPKAIELTGCGPLLPGSKDAGQD